MSPVTPSSAVQSWEARLVATGVTDFEGAPVVPRPSARKAAAAAAAAAAASTSEDKKLKTEDGKGSNEAGPSDTNKARRTDGSSDTSAARTNGRDESAAHSGNGQEDDSTRAGDERKEHETNSDEIGSDLDDSDEEVEGDGTGEGMEGDTVLCLYDKVQRVKNKWKCVLKDGVANIDGRDYLFSRCNTEFEW